MTGPSRETRESLEAATLAYQRDWWRSDADAKARLADKPDLVTQLERQRLVRTADIYLEPASQAWADCRRPMHDSLVAAQLGVGEAVEGPEAYFAIGCIGAGKSRVLRRLVDARRWLREERPSTLSRIAADEIRIALPEYARGLGSEVVAQECYDLTYDSVYPAARDARVDVVYETIGLFDREGQVGFAKNLRELRDAGFTIHVLLADAPLELCVQRAQRRALFEDGRLVSATVQQDMYEQPARALRVIRDAGLVDEYAVIDTSGPAVHPPMLDGSAGWRDLYQAVLDVLGGSGDAA